MYVYIAFLRRTPSFLTSLLPSRRYAELHLKRPREIELPVKEKALLANAPVRGDIQKAFGVDMGHLRGLLHPVPPIVSVLDDAEGVNP